MTESMHWDPDLDPVPFRAEESVKWRLSRVQEGLNQLTMELADQGKEQRAQLRRLGIATEDPTHGLTGGLRALAEVNDRIVANAARYDRDDRIDAARYALAAGQVVTRDRFNESMRQLMEPDPAALDHLAEYRARVQEATNRWLHPQGGHEVLPPGQQPPDLDALAEFRAAFSTVRWLHPDTFWVPFGDQDTEPDVRGGHM